MNDLLMISVGFVLGYWVVPKIVEGVRRGVDEGKKRLESVRK